MDAKTEQKTTITIEHDKQSFIVENLICKSEIAMFPDALKVSAEKIIQE